MRPHLIRKLLMLIGMLICGAVQAAFPAFEGYAAASDEELDRMRGGFEFNFNGMQLMLAFSLEQLTYINGELVSSMKLNPLQLIAANPAPAAAALAASTQPSTRAENAALPVSAATPAEAALTPIVASQVINNQGIITLVQNGTGNVFTLPESLSSLNTVIQNTVNDQVIRNLTILNATLSIQSAAAAMRLDAALNQAIAAGIR